ncbi:MAG: YciI family protein [Dermatophilaceae bacterium]
MGYWVLEFRYTDMDLRNRVRPEHLAYFTALHERGMLVLGGPVGDGSGALAILRADTEEQVWEAVAADPYTISGAGAEHVLRPWTVAIGG